VQLNQALLMSNSGMPGFTGGQEQMLQSLYKMNGGAAQPAEHVHKHRRYHSTNTDSNFMAGAKPLHNLHLQESK